MILAMDVLRWVTVKAILGRTWAGGRVYDSPAQASDLRMREERAPFVAVYTDDADVQLSGNDQDDSMGLSNPTVYLLIEVAVGEPQTIEDVAERQVVNTDAADDTHGAVAVQLAATDQALEANIAILSRQVHQALLATDSPWAELWRKLAIRRTRIEVRRVGTGQEERQPVVRYASRIMRYTCEVLSDPVYGDDVPEGFWADFLALAEADDDMAGLAAFVRAEITPQEGRLPDWRIAQKQLGATYAGVVGLGIAPVEQVRADEEDAPGLETGGMHPGHHADG